MGKTLIDLTGVNFGMLTVVSRHPENYKGGAQWVCKCSCGNIVVKRAAHLKRGDVRSCGCMADKKRNLASAEMAQDWSFTQE